jgi:hypothetical protein
MIFRIPLHIAEDFYAESRRDYGKYYVPDKWQGACRHSRWSHLNELKDAPSNCS